MSYSKNQAIWAVNEVLKKYPTGAEFSVPDIFSLNWPPASGMAGAIGRAFYDEVMANHQGDIRVLSKQKKFNGRVRAFYKKR